MALTYTETAWNTGGTATTGGAYKEVTVSASAGDLLVAFGAIENYKATSSTREVTTTSGATSAWTPYAPTTVGDSDVDAVAARATVSTGGSITVRVTLRGESTYRMGAAVWKIPAAEWTGTPSGVTFAADADGQVSASPAATSTVLYGAGDWSATNPGTTNTPTGATNHASYYDGTNYAVAVRSWTGQAAGTRNYGPSGLSGKDYSGVVVIVAEAGASSFTGTAATALPALTQSASGTRTLPAFTGTAASQVPALTQSGSGAVTAPGFSGGAASGLPALEQSATGAAVPPTFTGTAATTLPALTQAGAGAVGGIDVTGTAASALPALTQSAAGGGAVLNLFSTTPSIAATIDNPVTLGVEFYVNTSGKTLTKIRYLVPSSGANTSATRTCALYSTLDGYTLHELVAGPFTMPAGTAGQWCEYTLASPVALTANLRYRAAVWHDQDAGYAGTANYFDTGDGATTTTIGGFLVRPNLSDNLSLRQGSYAYGSSIAYPTEAFAAANYWTDVAVSGSGSAFIGTGASTLGALTQSGAGTFATPGVTGSSAQTLPALTQAGAGVVVNPTTGTGASALPALTQSASGTYLDEYFDTYSGDIGTTLPTLTQAAEGTRTLPGVTGTASTSLPALTQSASGATVPPAFTGAAASVLAAVVQLAAGTTLPPEYTGTAASTLPSLTQAGAGAVDNPEGAAGSAASTLPALTQAGAGTYTPPTAGAATSTLPALTQAATGTHTPPIYAAVIATILPALTQAARDAIRRDTTLTATGPRGRRWTPIGPRS